MRVGVWQDRIQFFTGIIDGEIDLRVEFYDSPPELITMAWEEVAELSLDLSSGDYEIVTADSFVMHPPRFNFAGAGTYRLRVHARGRWDNHYGTSEEVREFFLLQLWKAESASDAMLKSDARRLDDPVGPLDSTFEPPPR